MVAAIPIVGDVKLFREILRACSPVTHRSGVTGCSAGKRATLYYWQEEDNCLKPQFVIEELYRLTGRGYHHHGCGPAPDVGRPYYRAREPTLSLPGPGDNGSASRQR